MVNEPKGPEVKVGEWYECAICASCRWPIPILWVMRDAPKTDDGTFAFKDVPCPHCTAVHDYRSIDLVRLQCHERPSTDDPQGPRLH